MLRVEFTPTAEKGLGKIDRPVAQRILKKVRWLAENAAQVHHEPLAAQFAGMYKLRVGEYRVVYTIEGTMQDRLVIHLIGHRREIYKMR